jgi:hypothetical protein
MVSIDVFNHQAGLNALGVKELNIISTIPRCNVSPALNVRSKKSPVAGEEVPAAPPQAGAEAF